MTKANCCRILLISLLLPAMQVVRAEGLDKTNPDMGFQVASSSPAPLGSSASKLEKLNDTIRQAAEEYKQGHFDRAAQWYDSALQIDPERKDLQQSLTNARQMQQAQQRANAQLPRDPQQRDKFLSIAFDQAQQYLTAGKFQQASQAFYKLWLTAGDYQGKTLRAYTDAQAKFKAAQPADATVVASAAPAAAIPPAAASAAPVVAAGDSAKSEVLLDEVVPPQNTASGAESSVSAIDADLNKARAAIKTGYYDDAQRILNDVLARDPKNTAARTELDRIAALTNDAAQRAAALANWKKIDNRQFAQATGTAPGASLTPVYNQAMATTASLSPVAQPTASPTVPPADMNSSAGSSTATSSSPAGSAASGALPGTMAESTPAAVATMTTGTESNLLPANSGASTTGGPTGGAAEGVSGGTTSAAEASQPASTGGGPDDLTRLQANRLLRQAEIMNSEGKTQEAIKAVRQSLDLWPDNPRAQEMMQRYTGASGSTSTSESHTETMSTKSVLEQHGGTASEIQSRAGLGHQLEELHRQALQAYDAGDLGRARALWNQMLSLDPGNKLAHIWLENTEETYQRQAANKQTRTDIEARSEAAQKLLNSPITISTDHRIPLSEFMNALSYVTPVGLQYYLAPGTDAPVFANFVNKPLREVLDTVLKPIGLDWSIDEKNVITIQPHMISKTYPLTSEQITQVRALMDSGGLQRIVWGQTEKPAPGVDLVLDERHNILVVTGSQLHIQKVEGFLPNLKTAQGTDLEMKIYKIRPEDGARIKALINSIIQAQPGTPFDLERKIYVDGEDLIVRDTPENITKIEELLTNKKFITDLRNDKLDIMNFSLVPKEVENIQSDEVRNFTSRIVEAVQVFLYNTEGIAKAREEGRRMWFDDATLQLTVVDTPTNLQRVADYIEALPELRQHSLQKVVFLKYALAEDLSSNLLRILDLETEGGTSGESNNGQEAVFKLRRGEERQFRNARIRVLRVQDNDPKDRNDDSVELTMTIPGTGPQNQTVQELDSVQVDDYEITAEDVLPSTGNPGEGSARLRIRYVPRNLTADQLAAQENGGGVAQQASTLESSGISINPFGTLNALIIRYTNPGLYQDATELIQQLDQPTKQVEIETKFVQVNETRAKEFSSDFNFANLGNGKNVDWSQSTVNTRFAQDIDEFRDPYSPPLESPFNNALGKGTTVIGAIFGGASNVQWNLRLLEAEGIVNIVNGPKVMSLNGEEAEFRIETTVPQSGILGGNGTGNLITQVGGGATTGAGLIRSLTIASPFGTTTGNNNLTVADTDEATPADGGLAGAVILRMTPQITSENSIILQELSAELIDFDGYLGDYAIRSITDTGTGTAGGGLLPGQLAQLAGQPLLKRKKIITYARIANGGTIVIGGWTGEHSQEYTSGVPVLRNMPYLGKLLFSRNQRSSDRTTLLIFLTGYLVD